MENRANEVRDGMELVVNFGFYYVAQMMKTIYEMDLFNPFKRSLYERLNIPDDAFRSFEQICEKYGYISETHKVITEDGYINIVHRINNAMYANWRGYRPVIIMTHGILDSSDTWILNGKDKSPAFIAADAGFDVWLTNTRGNKYSNEHVYLDSRFDKDYWDHSFVEISNYDIPAFINYVKRVTNMPKDQKVSLITHSQSTTETFYGMAKNGKYYEDNVDVHIAIAPIALVTRLTPIN